MLFLAVNKNGTEIVSNLILKRFNGMWVFYLYEDDDDCTQTVELPKGSIKKLIGKEITWNDEPIIIKENEKCLLGI